MPEDLQDPQNSVSDPSALPKRDFRQEVTDQIIEMLEKGTAPWQTPWERGTLQLPHNPTTNRAYRGGNARI
jgi:antirestriction protein ArdC